MGDVNREKENEHGQKGSQLAKRKSMAVRRRGKPFVRYLDLSRERVQGASLGRSS